MGRKWQFPAVFPTEVPAFWYEDRNFRFEWIGNPDIGVCSAQAAAEWLNMRRQPIRAVIIVTYSNLTTWAVLMAAVPPVDDVHGNLSTGNRRVRVLRSRRRSEGARGARTLSTPGHPWPFILYRDCAEGFWNNRHVFIVQTFLLPTILTRILDLS
jgi:hypothetical protein